MCIRPHLIFPVDIQYPPAPLKYPSFAQPLHAKTPFLAAIKKKNTCNPSAIENPLSTAKKKSCPGHLIFFLLGTEIKIVSLKCR